MYREYTGLVSYIQNIKAADNLKIKYFTKFSTNWTAVLELNF